MLTPAKFQRNNYSLCDSALRHLLTSNYQATDSGKIMLSVELKTMFSYKSHSWVGLKGTLNVPQKIKIYLLYGTSRRSCWWMLSVQWSQHDPDHPRRGFLPLFLKTGRDEVQYSKSSPFSNKQVHNGGDMGWDNYRLVYTYSLILNQASKKTVRALEYCILKCDSGPMRWLSGNRHSVPGLTTRALSLGSTV